MATYLDNHTKTNTNTNIMTYIEFTLRLLSGMGAGMLIGFERQW
jgi:uncharacterized membrane protein YhiD involved in acid resistance